MRRSVRRGVVYWCGTLLAGLLTAGSAAQAQIIGNGSFESQLIASNSYLYHYDASFPATGWTFLNGGLVNGPNTAFNTPGSAPDGSQVAFLQTFQGSTATLSRSITLPTSGTYQLTFDVGARTNGSQPGNTTFMLMLGGTQIGSGSTTTNQGYTPMTVLFGAAAGTYLFSVISQGANQADNTAFFDDFMITAVNTNVVPEPASVALLGAGLAFVGAFARRRVRG